MSAHEACWPLSTNSSRNGENHEIAKLPTRVLDIGTHDQPMNRVRLLESGNLLGRYVCLSHRWGQLPKLQTTRATLKAFQRALPMAHMPQTFRDAIEVTRRLGFQYLWIDSLCIIQDDKDDWFRESQNMGAIFEEAVCTIAAVDAMDGDDVDHGLFRPCNKDTLAVKLELAYDKIPLTSLSQLVFKKTKSTCIWKYRWLKPASTSNDLVPSTLTLRPRIISASKRLLRSSWHNRGWVLQERLLSRRIIYYTKEKLSWGCFNATGEEEGGDPTAATRRSLFESSISGIWESIVSDYQNCVLTFNSDRLAALSGISTKLKARFSCTFHAGILHTSNSNEVSDSLLWYARKGILDTFDDFHAPSWSWVGLRGPLSFNMTPPNNAEAHVLINRLHFQTQNVCEYGNPSGKCQGTCVSGSISLVAPGGTMYRSSLLKDLRVYGYPDEPITDGNILSRIIGSCLVTQYMIPRIDQEGQETPRPYDVPLPDHTEVLEGECGCLLGFFIPDRDDRAKEVHEKPSILCIGIKKWIFPDRPNPSQSVDCEEQAIDILGLCKTGHSEKTFRRVGRGRIICNSWLRDLREMAVEII